MPEYITEDPPGSEWWVCLCKNTPDGSGFYPIDETVNEVPPTEDDWKTNCFCCMACGRVIDVDSLQVMRQIDPRHFVAIEDQKPARLARSVLEGEHMVGMISPHLGVVVDASNCIMLRTFLNDGTRDRDITLSDVRALTTALANAQSIVRLREGPPVMPSYEFGADL
jgi:hypothetical protein